MYGGKHPSLIKFFSIPIVLFQTNKRFRTHVLLNPIYVLKNECPQNTVNVQCETFEKR